MTVDGEIHHSEKRVSIHILLLADLTHRLVAEAETYPEASQTLQQVVVVPYQEYHLVVGLIHFLILHRLVYLKRFLKRGGCYHKPP